jgi:hypothetical protein
MIADIFLTRLAMVYAFSMNIYKNTLDFLHVFRRFSICNVSVAIQTSRSKSTDRCCSFLFRVQQNSFVAFNNVSQHRALTTAVAYIDTISSIMLFWQKSIYFKEIKFTIYALTWQQWFTNRYNSMNK